MNARLEKWFTNGDKTRYKIAVDAENFVDCPTKKVLFSAGLQVVKDDAIQSTAKWSLTVFGEERVKWFAELGIPVDCLPWEKNTIAIANGIKRADTPYMKKAELISILENLMEREVEYMEVNAMIKPEYRNLKLKKL
jgi:hypothetical protein